MPGGSTVGEKFLRKLFDEMEARYVISREERRQQLEEKYGAPVYFVHEILECCNKDRMRAMFPEIAAAEMYSPRFVVGWLIEEGIKKVLGIETEQVHWDRLVEVDGESVVVAGSADLVDGDSGKVIEIKYLTTLWKSPHEHHVLQLAMYLWGMGKRRGELWEISPEGVVSIEVEALSHEAALEHIRRKMRGEKAPVWDWECDFCPFEKFCPDSVSRRRCER